MHDFPSGHIPITAKQLEELRQVDITKIDKDTLVDLRSIRIDPEAPIEVRMQRFLEQIKNPYAYRVGDIAVKVEFTDGGKPLEDVMAQYLSSLKDHV